jgi:hypothetical protein
MYASQIMQPNLQGVKHHMQGQIFNCQIVSSVRPDLDALRLESVYNCRIWVSCHNVRMFSRFRMSSQVWRVRVSSRVTAGSNIDFSTGSAGSSPNPLKPRLDRVWRPGISALGSRRRRTRDWSTWRKNVGRGTQLKCSFPGKTWARLWVHCSVKLKYRGSAPICDAD